MHSVFWIFRRKRGDKSTISEVIVYTQGAQIYRKAAYSVKPGQTDLIIEGVSPTIDPKSLQVKAQGGVVLMDSFRATISEVT